MPASVLLVSVVGVMGCIGVYVALHPAVAPGQAFFRGVLTGMLGLVLYSMVFLAVVPMDSWP